MNILLLAISFAVAALLGIFFFLSLLRKQNLSAMKFMTAAATDNRGPGRILGLGLYLWTIFFLLAQGSLLFVAIMCAFYAIGLIHGEFFLLLEAIPATAGNIIVHLVYPLEVFLFGLFALVLFFGSFQIFLGPIHPLSRLALKVDGVGDLCRKLIGLLAVILLLELTKTAAYALLVNPAMLERFFAGNLAPLMRPGAMAMLVGVSVTVAGAMAGGPGRGGTDGA